MISGFRRTDRFSAFCIQISSHGGLSRPVCWVGTFRTAESHYVHLSIMQEPLWATWNIIAEGQSLPEVAIWKPGQSGSSADSMYSAQWACVIFPPGLELNEALFI